MPKPIIKPDGSIEIFGVDASKVSANPDGTAEIRLDEKDFAGLKPTVEQWNQWDLMAQMGTDISVTIHTVDGETVTSQLSGGAFESFSPPRKRAKREPKPVQAPRDEKNRPIPTLADELLFNHKTFFKMHARKHKEAAISALRRSRQFVFDTEATARVGELCRDMPEMIADHSEFARAPYETTWVELDAAMLYHSINGKQWAKPDEDVRIGFLFTGNTVYMASATKDKKGRLEPKWLPVFYTLHQPMTFDEEQEAARLLGTSRIVLDQFIWGSSYNRLDKSHRRILRASHSFGFAVDPGLADGKFAPMMRSGGAGDMRVLLALALLLIRPSTMKTIYERGQERHRTVKGVKTFLAHNVVTIKLNQERLVRRISHSVKIEQAKKRRHEVRGTYCHNEAGRSSCVHDWREIEPLHWECAVPHCGGKRWWRKPHQRGDENIGYITKHYVVKRGKVERLGVIA